nr:wiskott-Aldrich syndrome protein homolog 1-like [Aegilops tauschii subsp. strangulata]
MALPEAAATAIAGATPPATTGSPASPALPAGAPLLAGTVRLPPLRPSPPHPASLSSPPLPLSATAATRVGSWTDWAAEEVRLDAAAVAAGLPRPLRRFGDGLAAAVESAESETASTLSPPLSLLLPLWVWPVAHHAPPSPPPQGAGRQAGRRGRGARARAWGVAGRSELGRAALSWRLSPSPSPANAPVPAAGPLACSAAPGVVLRDHKFRPFRPSAEAPGGAPPPAAAWLSRGKPYPLPSLGWVVGCA